MRPLVSIITVCRNAGPTIGKNIKSVQKQTYENVEHVFIDGKSTDDTLTVITDLVGVKANIISEKDDGIYDAMNKGLRIATGELLIFLNADDWLHNQSVLANIINLYQENQDMKIFYGGIQYVSASGNYGAEWRPSSYAAHLVTRGWHTPHPGFVITRECLDAIGFFNLSYSIAADYDYMLRCFLKFGNESLKLNMIITNMRDDGVSSSLRGILEGQKDIVKSLKENGITTNLVVFLFSRYAPKVLRKFSKLLKSS
jgi:glycosyltransferase involved in cell wall biosynthesis